MKKRFEFGKVDLNGTGRKINRVYVDVELCENKQGQTVFSASGAIMNSRNTDCICGGQCIDEISKFVDNPTFNTIRNMWKLYHLNDLHAGTKEQEIEVKKWLKETNQSFDYGKVCDHLKEVGLYESTYNNKPYLYGHGWIYEPIPEEDLKTIKNLLKN